MRRGGGLAPESALRLLHRFVDFHGAYADGRHALEEVDDFVFVVGEFVGVGLFPECGVFGGFLFVWVENPFEGGAVAEFVVPGFAWDAEEAGFAVE